MSKYNVHNDEIQFLQNDGDDLLISYGMFGFFGTTGSGKTYQMNYITSKYIAQAASSVFDIDQPTLNNGPITYDIYVSPSVKMDQTVRNSSDTKFIEATDERLQIIFKFFSDMETIVGEGIRQQTVIRNMLKRGEKLELEHLKALENIQRIKAEYPELKVKETNKALLKKYSQQPQLLEWIRRPKIMLRIDDFWGMKISTSTKQELIRILVTRRHIGIWFSGIALHKFVEDLSGLWTAQILFKGVEGKIINDITSQFIEFQPAVFKKLYGDTTQKENYSFVSVIFQPQFGIYVKWRKYDGM